MRSPSTSIIAYLGHIMQCKTLHGGSRSGVRVESGPLDLLGLGEGVQDLLLVLGQVVVPVDELRALTDRSHHLGHDPVHVTRLERCDLSFLGYALQPALTGRYRAHPADLPAVRTDQA